MSMYFDFPQELIGQLNSLGDEQLQIECLQAVEQDIVNSVRSELSKHDDTGAMSKSVKSNGIKQNKQGDYYMFVSPKGKDKKTGVNNGLKAVMLQYGNSHQQATPWLETAKKNVEQQIIDKWQAIINSKLGG